MGEMERRSRAVVEEALRLLVAKDMTGFAKLWAEDGIIEWPFAGPGFPQRVEGRSAVHEYMAHYPELVDVREILAQTIHETLDPAVAIVEFEVGGVVVRTDKPYRMRYVAVVTTRDGEITCYRDYWSPLAAAEAMDGADVVNASFTPSVRPS